MVILKPGDLFVEQLRGTCPNCGCEVECEAGELRVHPPTGQRSVTCPYRECGGRIPVEARMVHAGDVHRRMADVYRTGFANLPSVT